MHSKMIQFKYKRKEIYIDGQKLIPKVPGLSDWGDESGGARLTALNLLGSYVHAPAAFKAHVKFTEEIISQIPKRDYELDESIVAKWIVKNCRDK